MKIKGKTFYEEIQTNEGLDLRDNRGKRHCLGLVLLGLILGLLRKRDGCLSSPVRTACSVRPVRQVFQNQNALFSRL